MKTRNWILYVAALAAVNAPFMLQSHAGLFKIDFGNVEEDRIPVDADGNPTGDAPGPAKDWDIIGNWTLADPHGTGAPDGDGTTAIWKLTDFSTDKNTNVTVTMLDNKAAAELANPETPPYLVGQTGNNPTHEGVAAVYDGVLVPATVKDDYLYRSPDTAGTEVLMRFANLTPGFYNVTVFEGRTTDASRYGKVWADDITGKKEPAEQNTGNYSGVNSSGVILTLGQPRTVTVEVKAGEYLWFAEMEDNSGGISGMIIRSVTAPPPPIDVTASKGLFKIDFGQFENERVPTDADGNPTGDAPAPLKDWNVIPTWTFEDPAANVIAGSASLTGTPNADHTEVTWKLIDASKDANKNVTMTMLDNKALAEQLSPDSPAYMTGQTANNPTKEAYDAVYDGVEVPAVVKDDYLYRVPDTAGNEVLMRFANLNPGTYNVTVFEGRTTDSNGRFGKVWVDDISGKKEPAEQNTGNYSGVNVDVGAVATPVGQPKTVTVDVKAGEYLWFAEMEDNSGGISGMIIRGTGGSSPAGAPTLAVQKGADGSVTLTYTGALYSSDTVNGKFNVVAGATSPLKITPATAGKSATFYRAGP